MAALAERVAKLRSAHNWTQAELAHRAGVKNYQSIQQIENGEVLEPKKLRGLAKAFGVEPEDLTGESGISVNDLLTKSRRALGGAGTKSLGVAEKDEEMELRKYLLAKRIFDHLLELSYDEVHGVATVLRIDPPEDAPRPRAAGQR